MKELELDTFIHNLHFDTEKLAPPDWQVDWEGAPLPYKLYRGLPAIPLNANVPSTLHQNLMPTLKEIGHLLWYTYGITQYVRLPHDTQSLRRYVPSGGALYPNEIYVYMKLEDAKTGIYHYDVAHHRLILLREGNFDTFVSKSLGTVIEDCFCTVFISTFFWKNFYKYNHFSYRLQGLDTGVLIGQLLEVADQLDYNTKVCYQFLDRAMNHLLGLSEEDESVYAVIPISTEAIVHTTKEMVSSHTLCAEIAQLGHLPHNLSKTMDYPLLRKLNEAAMFDSSASFRKVRRQGETFTSGTDITLPNTQNYSYDFSSICKKRYSPDADFMMGEIRQATLATLLKETCSFSYHHDLDDTDGHVAARVALYGSLYNVEGIPNGAYAYDNENHMLRLMKEGDYRPLLHSSLVMPNVNLYQVPLCMHVIGDKSHYKDSLGYRGYRIQQMEAGLLTQRLLLHASALDLGGHPLLGYSVSQCDQLYGLASKGKTSLIQIPVGMHRPRAWLKGGLR